MCVSQHKNRKIFHFLPESSRFANKTTSAGEFAALEFPGAQQNTQSTALVAHIDILYITFPSHSPFFVLLSVRNNKIYDAMKYIITKKYPK